MCEAIDNECIALQRVRIGEWTIEGIKEGQRKEMY